MAAHLRRKGTGLRFGRATESGSRSSRIATGTSVLSAARRRRRKGRTADHTRREGDVSVNRNDIPEAWMPTGRHLLFSRPDVAKAEDGNISLWVLSIADKKAESLASGSR